jgi:PIN domain nuclease of toxin-antitoxin system
MKALLDTHTFLWWTTNDPRLSPAARAFIMDGRNEVYFSVASAWEIAIKAARGRLGLPSAPDRYVTERLRSNGFKRLPIQMSHALEVYHLPPNHADPFDRLLIAQSRLENLPLLSGDGAISSYDVKTIW